MQNNNWWEGPDMFNNFDPYAELQQLKQQSVMQQNTINQLIQNNNKLQDLLVELSQQHQNITQQYGNFHKRLNAVNQELNTLKANTIVFTNDLESK